MNDTFWEVGKLFGLVLLDSSGRVEVEEAREPVLNDLPQVGFAVPAAADVSGY